MLTVFDRLAVIGDSVFFLLRVGEKGKALGIRDASARPRDEFESKAEKQKGQVENMLSGVVANVCEVVSCI